MWLARQFMYFGMFLYIPSVASQATLVGYLNKQVEISCGVGGSYTLPQWRKDGSITLAIQDSAGINTLYPQFKLGADQTTLVITSAQLSDAGSYECTYAGKPNSPYTTIVSIQIAVILVSCFGKGIAVCVFFVLTIVDYIVVIITCIYMLNIDDNKKRRQLPYVGLSWQTQVWVILITAIVIFIAVSGWFIGMMVTVDAFQEMTQSNCNVYIGLLSFEVFDFVLGVCLIICLFYISRDLWKKRSVMKAKVEPQSGDTEQHHSDVSPRHRPQPALPPHERHGSDHSSVSRKDPIPPIYKNISTTEFHMDKTGSERSNINTSNQGLSTKIDQEFHQPRTNRLAPLDHTVMDESIRRKKKKKNTKTNNDHVKFDNDND